MTAALKRNAAPSEFFCCPVRRRPGSHILF
jgi:hypothetical protein